ncbi:O-antigen ligase family protein [Curvibacter sp. APW13]|uniref:O-antigen ligase family protein n=1 Tax=Curvibacter sp. APW13 TaxID=3077236 RepID=UPI0028DE5AF5|nr:O-antigen ligase family protein [Curvibacter sp. APW13]MDT8990221.1 O-antigen ligase family protein [Curvibacter sp. APW13]
MNSRPIPTLSNDWSAGILAATLFLVPAVGVPHDYLLQDTLKSAVAAFGVLAAGLLFFMARCIQPRALAWHWIVLIPVTLCLYALCSSVWGHAYLSAVESLRWLLIGALVFLSLNVFAGPRQSRAFWAIHWGAVAASLWIMVYVWTGLTPFPQGAPPAATFYNRNFAAEYIVTTLPLSFYLAWKHRSVWSVGVSGLLPVPGTIAVLMTGTRSALLALLVYACCAVAWLAWRRVHKLALPDRAGRASLLTTALCVVVLGSIPSSRYSQLPSHNDKLWDHVFARAQSVSSELEPPKSSFNMRVAMWKASVRMLQDKPWTGVGAGAWEVEVPRYQDPDTMLELDYYAHSDILQLLSEYGLVVGGLSLAFLLAACLQRAAPTPPLPQDPQRYALLAALIGLATVSLFGFPLRLAGGGMLFAVLLGMLFSPVAYPVLGSLGKRTYAGGVAVFSLGLLAAVWLTMLAGRAEYHLLRALDYTQQLAKTPKTSTATVHDLVDHIHHEATLGIQANPHYRKLSPMISEVLMAHSQWPEAIWILESVVASRPHVPALLEGLALARAQLGDRQGADAALAKLQALRPAQPAIRNTELVVLANTGRDDTARARAQAWLADGLVDVKLLQSIYALGLKTHDWPLALSALRHRNRLWPEQAADGHFRMGMVYADPAVHNRTAAVEAFRQGLDVLPPAQRENYLQQVPASLRADVEKGT